MTQTIGTFCGKQVEILSTWEGSRGRHNLNATVRNTDGTKVNDGLFVVEEYVIPLGFIKDVHEELDAEEELYRDQQMYWRECEELRCQRMW